MREVDIAIVGGGTAGWLTALALARCFGSARIMLVESPVVSTIGVGESTLPTIGHTLHSLGLNEQDWMATVGATYKLGVRFVDWCQPGSDISRADFWNPVEQITDPAAVIEWFEQARSSDFAQSCCATPPLLERDLIPRTLAGERLGEYAFHVDATKLAAVLKAKAIEHGVIHRRDHVVDLRPSSAGIDTIELEDTG
jgi:tryptophan halogenase